MMKRDRLVLVPLPQLSCQIRWILPPCPSQEGSAT